MALAAPAECEVHSECVDCFLNVNSIHYNQATKLQNLANSCKYTVVTANHIKD
jgi:hypothetical protein